MHAERPVLLTFADDAERERFDQMLAERPQLYEFARAGIEAAAESFVPRMHAAAWGMTGAEIDRAIAVTSAEGDRIRAGAPKAHRLSEDERLIFRLAYEAACRQARNDFLAALTLHEPAAKALIALASLGKAVVEGVAALQAAAAPHALAARPAPLHRRLRPEDFGALPSRPRS